VGVLLGIEDEQERHQDEAASGANQGPISTDGKSQEYQPEILQRSIMNYHVKALFAVND
jgi:hypothetical protein